MSLQLEEVVDDVAYLHLETKQRRDAILARVINQLTNREALTELCSGVKHAESG